MISAPHQRVLHEALREGADRQPFVGQSRALARVQKQLEQVADTHLTVLGSDNHWNENVR